MTRPAARARAVVAGIAIPIIAPILTAAIGKVVAPSDGAGPPLWFSFAVAMFFVLGAAVGAFGALRATKKSQRVAVGADELVLGERRIPRSSIESGYVAHHSDRDVIELQLKGGEPLSLRVAEGKGNALLDLLELGASQRRARVSLATPGERALIGFGGAAIGAIALVMLFGLVTAVVPASALAALMASPLFSPLAAAAAVSCAAAGASRTMKAVAEIEIGVDGVAYSEPTLFRKRTTFVPFDDVERVQIETYGGGRVQAARVVLVHTGGARTAVAALHVTKRDQIEAIAARIRAALTAFRAGEGSWARMLERATEPVDAWLSRLRGLAKGTGGYREPALADEQLANVDPKAPADVRLGAAVVLSARSESSARERVRIAADTTTSPRLRVALESVARGSIDEAAVAEALESEAEAEAEAAPPQGRQDSDA